VPDLAIKARVHSYQPCCIVRILIPYNVVVDTAICVLLTA